MSRVDIKVKDVFREYAQFMKNELSYEAICEMDEDQKSKYDSLLADFIKYNSIKTRDPDAPENLIARKGEVLEELVSHLLEVSGGIFEVKKNVRTHTNEVDQLVELNETGRSLQALKVIPNRLDLFLCECKNYGKRVSVTYTGKFCSLLQTCSVRLGILFSYHGLTGENWRDAVGLVKKFYLCREREEERYVIIDFNINDFKAIQDGSNLLQIIHDKTRALKLDTDFSGFISDHPAQRRLC